ncbi:hypothetical protein KSP40_PGU011588 [Platanthera guangdongensis]|uniref:DUF7950 domain-containing protein n=1 Tax=Platanthera guangdongensis TaxID=2320717 RepID=A0ABR2LLF2_9ASPA
MYEPVDVAKTHEILARFRPIAPKPQIPHAQIAATAPQLRPRPSRTRKRGRTAADKRQKASESLAASSSSFLFSLTRPNSSRDSQPLVERDLLRNLQAPKIISPRPVRPVGSSISVGVISEGAAGSPPPAAPKRPEEVEDEVESDALPAVVSDGNNRVRMANSAYKEMVGQPECVWLDSMVGHERGIIGRQPCSRRRRINGEVILDFSGEGRAPPLASLMEGFSCRAKIEWACDGRKTLVDAPCEVIRVYCESKDYLFAWRFHIAEACRTTDSVSSLSASS